MNGTLSLSRSLYEPAAVRAAIAAYEGLARIELTETGDDLVVRIADPDPDVADCLVDEFCNHALLETIVLRSSNGNRK